jgi:hypothetical protein
MEKIIGVLAGITIGSAQLIYLINGLQKKVTPNVLSWLGWGFLMGTSLVSQVIAKGWQWSMTGILCSTVGCVAIAAVAFFSRNFSFKRSDLIFLLAGLACVGVYLLSDNPWMTTVFAIAADALLGIPTIRKAILHPASERSVAWVLGMVSSTLALVICLNHDMIYILFPAYLLIFNGGMAVLTWRRGVVVAAGCCIIAAGCSKHSSAGAFTRSYRMGFAASAPQPTINSILQSLSLWPQHSDATIISTEVPWDSLLNGENAVTYVENNYTLLVGICRQQNLKLWIYIDPENGLDRASDSYPLVALGKSIAQPAMQQVYRQFVVAMDSVLQPDHLGLALETNLIRFIAPDSIYQGVKNAVNAAAEDIRAFDTHVPLGVSVQAEVAWGKLGGSGFVGVSQDFTDFPFLQELGISSYPYLGGFAAPANIPLNYYTQLVSSHSLPVFVSEGGWSSAYGGLAMQAAYIDRQGQMLTQAHGIGLFQLAYTDLELSTWPAVDSAGLVNFAYIGVVDSSFNPKPAQAAWDSLRKAPLQAGH